MWSGPVWRDPVWTVKVWEVVCTSDEWKTNSRSRWSFCPSVRRVYGVEPSLSFGPNTLLSICRPSLHQPLHLLHLLLLFPLTNEAQLTNPSSPGGHTKTNCFLFRLRGWLHIWPRLPLCVCVCVCVCVFTLAVPTLAGVCVFEYSLPLSLARPSEAWWVN